VTKHHSLLAEETALRRRFRVVESQILAGGRTIPLLHPASAEELIDEEAFERDERLPYWAEVWPSARILAERVLTWQATGRTLLELGCGSGLVSTCAAIAGFDVTASDYYEDAVRFARVNASRNGATIRGMTLDWRAVPGDLARFDAVVASDVLYERPYGELVAQVIARTLADGGIAVVADPGRVGRADFLTALPAQSLEIVRQTAVRYEREGVRQTITLFEIRRTS
jgi:predicted nicotinamide N-methyase